MQQGTPASDPILYGFLGSLAAGLAGGVGAAGVFAFGRLSAVAEDVLLSVAAGIMLAATFFSLLLPALDSATAQGHGEHVAALIVSTGLLGGALALWALNRIVPHEHFHAGREGPAAVAVRRIWLFVIAITIHNVPEGMAVGVGFGTGDVANGIALATGIGIQNVPEGLAVAASLVAVDYSRVQAFTAGVLTSLVEPIGGLVGAAAVTLAAPALPWTLGFAAGAMLFIISDEIIPETHRRDPSAHATFALIGGFVLMTWLDFTLA